LSFKKLKKTLKGGKKRRVSHRGVEAKKNVVQPSRRESRRQKGFRSDMSWKIKRKWQRAPNPRKCRKKT